MTIVYVKKALVMYTSCDLDKVIQMSANMLNRSHAAGYIHHYVVDQVHVFV